LPLLFVKKGLTDMTKEKLKQEYLNNEELLWFGKAETSAYFSRADWLLIPLTLIIGGIMLMYVYSSVVMMVRGQSISFALSGITFLLIGLYLIFGRIWYRHKRIKRLVYAVTSERVIVLDTLRDVITLSLPLPEVLPCVIKNDLLLNERNFFADFVYGLGLDVFFHNMIPETPAFIGIKEPELVKQMIASLNKQRSAKTDDGTDQDFI